MKSNGHKLGKVNAESRYISIFCTQEGIHVCLEYEASPSMWQKKTTVGLKVTIVMCMQNIESTQMFYHTHAYAVTHNLKLVAYSEHVCLIDHFFIGQRRVHVAKSC